MVFVNLRYPRVLDYRCHLTTACANFTSEIVCVSIVRQLANCQYK
jgi:hypothetical protein